VLGEEAHIVSEEPNGPRFRPMPRKEVDAYANLLLLCPSDHKIVDEQVTYYTEQRLQTLKREHEKWVKDRISSTIPAIKIRDPEAGKPVILQRIDTGKELMNVLAHTLAAHHDNPEPRCIEEAELIGEFFQNTTDYTDIWDDIEPSGRILAEFSMSGEITRLREAGLVVYAEVPIELERPQRDNHEQAAMVSWISNELMNILSSLNLYEQKDVNPQLDKLKIDLESSRETLSRVTSIKSKEH